MKYVQKSFSTGANSQAYRDNFDNVFKKEEPAETKVCVYVDGTHLAPGWICCRCRTYNGIQRNICKVWNCQHERCPI